MAALSALEISQATVAVSRQEEVANLTSPWTTPVRPRRELPVGPAIRLVSKSQTAVVIDPEERGDEAERNRADVPESDRGRAEREPSVRPNDDAARVRSEQARDLIQRVEQLFPLVGDIAMATNAQLLKRDLCRCLRVLTAHPGEGDFVSIVTLVESSMAQRKWKDYTRPVLETIRAALDVGYRQVRVTFDDYDKVRRAFASKDVTVLPEIDLESAKWEDLEDVEKE